MTLHKMYTHLAVLALSVCSWGALAANVQADTLIRNVMIFEATGKAPFQADVLLRNGRFESIGSNLTTPAGTQVIDGKGLSMLPGLIDVHVHWTGMGGVSRADIATLLLQSGVTTATDYHSAPESFNPKRQWHKSLVSPHVIYTARTATPGGHGADWGDENMTRLATSALEGQTAIKQLQPYQPDMIKVFADGWRYGNRINNSSINIDALSAITAEAKQLNLPVVTHTVTVDGAKTAAEANVSAIVHAIQDRKADAELVSLMQSNKLYYAPTLAVYEPRPDKTQNNTKAQQALVMHRQAMSRYNLQLLAKAGIPIAVGTDSGIGGTPFGESTLRELELLVDFGLTPAQAVIAGTANSAAVLGLKHDRGTIEVGKRADFVLVKGAPWKKIADYRNTEFVFVDGNMLVKAGKLVTTQGPAAPAAVAADAIIDNFDSGDGLTTSKASRLAETDNGFPRSLVISQPVTRSANNKALHVSAKLAQKPQPYAYIVLPLNPGSVIPADASAFNGISFDIRGDGEEYMLEISSGTGKANTSFTAGTDWQTIKVPFSTLSQEFAPNQIYQVKFGAKRASGQVFWFELDNVRFIAE